MTVDERNVAPRAYEMAVELRHPIYDCMYLALAEALGEGLLTADHKFLARLKPHAFGKIARSL